MIRFTFFPFPEEKRLEAIFIPNQNSYHHQFDDDKCILLKYKKQTATTKWLFRYSSVFFSLISIDKQTHTGDNINKVKNFIKIKGFRENDGK